MSSLRELQHAFTAAVFDARQLPGVVGAIDAQGMGPEQRHGIYRNNIFHNYREALRDVYPVVERLVGEDFFRFAADRYIPRQRSRHGNLHRFGGGFGAFLDGFAPAAALPYLGDVARLEWRIHESFHAADHGGGGVGRLAAVPPEQLHRVRFALHPACRLFASQFPVHRIWEANQPGTGSDETIDLGAGAVQLLVRRRDYAVEVEPLAAAEFALLRGFAAGRPLGDALCLAQEQAVDFDLEAALRRRIADAVVVDCVVLRP